MSDLGAAAARADQIEILDPEQRAEIAYWVGGDRPDGTGVPMEVIPDAVTPSVVPGRDFVREGHLHVGEGSDRAAVYLMLFGDGDEPADWLRAGEALSSAWITATEHGLVGDAVQLGDRGAFHPRGHARHAFFHRVSVHRLEGRQHQRRS